jgi:hypothetical protein
MLDDGRDLPTVGAEIRGPGLPGQLGLEQEPGVDRLVVILLAVQSSSAYTSAF